jgi:di/tricarboxylate transporter
LAQISNPVNLMVMDPRRLPMRDYVRLDLPLAVMLWGVADPVILVIPLR